MKSLVVFIKSVFVPISAFLFLAIGVLACCFSGIVEYNVLKELLVLPKSNDMVINANFWPVVLVMVLEGSKFTLHFYHASLKRKHVKDAIATEECSVNLEKIVKCVKNALVGVSFICSIIFVTNVFFSDNGKSALDAKEKIEAQCDETLQKLKEDLETKRTEKRQSAKDSLDTDSQRINTLYDQLERIQLNIEETASRSKREDLQEEAKALREQITNKEIEYSNNLQKEYAIIDTWYDAELMTANITYGPNGTKRQVAESDFEAEAMGDNQYLYTFLRAITKTLFQKGYSRMTYFLCVIFLSVTISALLEACISISQNLLTLKVDTFYEILGRIPITENEHIIVRRFAWLLFSLICLLAGYIITGLCLNINVSRVQIVMAIMTYVVTLLFMDFSWTSQHKENRLTEEICLPLWKKLLKVLPDTLLSGLIAFSGYVLLGFLLNGNFSYGDLNSLAIALGGMMAQFFHRDKYNLSPEL